MEKNIDLNHLVEQLQQGKTLLYPTDTILGIGCDALNPQAIKRVNAIKNRPSSKNLILLVTNDAMLERYVNVADVVWDIIDLSDKPVTIIYDNPRDLPKEIVSEQNTIAIRKTNDPISRNIIQKLRGPLVSTSANLSGQPAPNVFNDINPSLLKEIDIVHPACKSFVPKHQASSIIQVTQEGYVKVIRA